LPSTANVATEPVELTQPGFDPSDYLTERGRAVYDMARTACFGRMADAVTAGRLSSRAALAY
jgi:hypothetical protein